MYNVIHCNRSAESAANPAPSLIDGPDIVELRVEGAESLTADIRHYRLRRSDGGLLPAWDAGAHIVVHLPDGKMRAYSLCGDPADASEYQIAVKLDTAGRGGTRLLHELATPGALLKVTPPRNLFALSDDDGPCLLIGGGIGVTPLVSMAHVLHRRGTDFRFLVFARSEQHLPLPADWRQQAWASRVELFLSQGETAPEAAQTQIRAVLDAATTQGHLYYCGPSGFMSTIDAASAHWNRANVHFERFSATLDAGASPSVHLDDPTTEGSATAVAPLPSFDLLLARSARRITVTAGQSAGQALHAAGIDIQMVCEQGVCASCVTRWIDGQPLHRDQCLTDEERGEYVAVCCVQSAGPTLTLDV